MKKANGKKKALRIVEFILEKKAQSPVILDVGKLTSLCDYFVICSADTDVQARAIFENVIDMCKENSITVHHREHDHTYQWSIIDTFDVLVHIFQEQARQYYHLEKLWVNAPRVRIPFSMDNCRK